MAPLLTTAFVVFLGVMIGDERSHYWRISGRRNLAFFGALFGLSRNEAAVRTERLLEEVDVHVACDSKRAVIDDVIAAEQLR